MTDVTIDLEEDAVPLVRIIGAQFRRALVAPAFVETARSMQGKFALKSANDPQSLTIEVKRGTITLTRGVAKDVELIITVDLDSGDVKKIDGLVRHPFLAMKAGKLLETYAPAWQEAAKRFWTLASGHPGMPTSIVLRCTDDNTEVRLGADGDPSVEIEGGTAALVEILTGSNVFLLAMMQGKLKSVASLEHAVVLSEVTKSMMLGDL